MEEGRAGRLELAPVPLPPTVDSHRSLAIRRRQVGHDSLTRAARVEAKVELQ